MISIPSTPRVLRPSLGSTATASSCPDSHPNATAAITKTMQHLPSTADITDNVTSTNNAKAECSKRPKHYLVHSHSSRHVHLTDDITPREMALSILQAQYHIYHTDLSGYLAGGAMVQDALTKYALGGNSTQQPEIQLSSFFVVYPFFVLWIL